MQIKYSFPYWGSQHLTPSQFITDIHNEGFEGAELFLQPPDEQTEEFMRAIEQIRKDAPDFYYILLQLPFPEDRSVASHIKAMLDNFRKLSDLDPLFINSHTGKDYFSFDDNCRIIDAAIDFSVKHNVRILHETHRGRFSFHAATLIPYLKKFPQMELVADFSHFCTVSESMLEDQQEIISEIMPHVYHIHARIGHEQGPQVNDPRAPEWQPHLETFMNWWKLIAEKRKSSSHPSLTITPEFGPDPYMPALPFTRQPLSNQWDNNLFMMKCLRAAL